MSEIHINRSGQNLGIFTQAEVQEGLNTGKYLGTDLAWRAGMENWKPLSQWSDFTIPSTGVPPLSGAIPILPSAGFVPGLADEQSLPSWEQKSELGFFNAFGATVKEVLLEPSATFSRMKETGGYMTPFLYLLISSAVITLFYFVLTFAFSGTLLSAIAAQNPEASRLMLANKGSNLGGMICNLIGLPIQVFIAAFLGSGMWHLALMILGGAKKPFEATFRVHSYSLGSTIMVSLIPCCGIFIAPVWNIVAGAIGLSKVHNISTGKAVLAILLPLILCCGFCGLGYYSFYHSLQGNPDFMNAFNKALNSR